MPFQQRTPLISRMVNHLMNLLFEPVDQPVGLTQLTRHSPPANTRQDANVFFQKRPIISDYRYEKIIHPDAAQSYMTR